MSGKWTPGPWTACPGAPEMKQRPGDCVCGHIFAGGDKHIATTHTKTQDSDEMVYAEWSQEERAANARLIAAAPALYHELETLLERYQEVTTAFLNLVGWSDSDAWPVAFHGLRADIEHADQVLRDAREGE